MPRIYLASDSRRRHANEEQRYRDLADSEEAKRVKAWADRELRQLSARDHARRHAAILTAIEPPPSNHWLAQFGRWLASYL